MREKKAMAGWFDPGLLVQTGIRAAISTVFGQFADRREAIAAANAVAARPADAEFDYAARHDGGDFWIDYLADTGDGWNPTYAVARLVSGESIELNGTSLPRGRLLVLGGDQVYPTASIEEYDSRFRYPFDEAYAPGGVPRWTAESEEAPDLYAIPGNHDWYDGLSAFFGLFCRRRVAQPGELGVGRRGAVIAGRQTRQTRSYFAVKLPGNWWLWGTDSQLEGYIDQPQIDYFVHAASTWMDLGSKLIICVADPSWAYVDPANPEKKFSSFSYLERIASRAVRAADPDVPDDPDAGTPMGHQLKLVLTGDSHHYARYVDSDDSAMPGEPERHYVVCGGGGAFLHPTHQLQDVEFTTRYPRPGVEGEEGSYRRAFRIANKVGAPSEKAVYPSAAVSRKMTAGNLLFAFRNWKFTALLFAAYLLFNWMLDFNARSSAERETLTGMLNGPATFGGAFLEYLKLLIVSPWPVLLMAIAFGGYYYFADSPRSNWKRVGIGSAHAVWQFAVVTVTIILVVRAVDGTGPVHAALSVLLATLASAVASATAFGIYLFVMLFFFKKHANEGFSSLQIEGFKSFLRLRIGSDGALTLYPIGLETVPKDDAETPADPPLSPHLIEGPIRIA
jgi:hypothetical protein